MSTEKRKNSRFQSQAKAQIVGHNTGETLLKDLSIIGCSLSSAVHAELKPDTRYEIEIFPEEAAGIGKFEIIVELKRVHSEGNTTEFGFSILESPKGRHFQRYVDYLSWRSETEAAGEESRP
jgi:hypothetical protein